MWGGVAAGPGTLRVGIGRRDGPSLRLPAAKVRHKFSAKEPWLGGPPASLSGWRTLGVSLVGVAA